MMQKSLRKFMIIKQHCKISKRCLSDDKNKFLSTYVQLPYSYAYGRSEKNVLYKTLGQLMDERLHKDTGRPFLISHHENITKYYQEFYQEINQLSMSLRNELNIKQGDVVGIWSSNVYEWLVIQYSCLRIGAILCTINPYYQSLELDYVIRKSEMKAIFMPGIDSRQNLIQNYSNILYQTLNTSFGNDSMEIKLKYLINIDGDQLGGEHLPAKYRSTIKTYQLNELKNNNQKFNNKSFVVSPDDPAQILFTSGTTGRPKGACLSHFTLVNNVTFTMNYFNQTTTTDEVNCCLPLPFFHSFAGILGNFMPIAFPRSQIIIPFLRYNLPELIDCIRKHNATLLFATPTLAIDLFNYILKNQLQLPSLKTLLTGGASVPEEMVYQFQEAIPSCTDIRIGYGTTETGPALSANDFDSDPKIKAQTVGRPIDFIEVKIVDPETKNLVKINEIGEIHTRGHHVMMGYWKEQEKTEKVLQNGWYNTEDLGTMDENGFIKIIGRTKEMIIVGGENVYPAEIENVLHLMNSVELASVVGVPDDRRGEEICAWIQYRKNVPQQSHDELREFCKEKLAYFKVPKYFITVDSFDSFMTATRKQQKFLMREESIKKLNLKIDKSK